jgi:uncharacterized membrane protein YfcA
MTPTLMIALTLTVLFVAALVKSTLGFGESLIAIPLLTLVLGIQTAAPLVSIMAGLLTAVIVFQNWQRMEFSTTWQLIVAAVIGVPFGVWGLRTLPETWLTTILGVLLIFIGIYYLAKPTLGALRGAHWAYLFGFVSGVFGGAYNMASPPVVVYGAMRRWSPEQFRVMLQGFFLPISIMILISQAAAGLWTKWVLQLFLLSLPVVILAYWLGSRFNQTMSTRLFEKLIYGGLIVLGAMLLI